MAIAVCCADIHEDIYQLLYRLGLTKACHEPQHIEQEWTGLLGFCDQCKAPQQIQKPHDPQKCVVRCHDVGFLMLQFPHGWHETPAQKNKKK